MRRTSSGSTRASRALLPRLRETDLLVVTADHGNDPTTPSTDHSREYVPVLLTRRARARPAAISAPARTFADLGQTLAENFGVGPLRARHELPGGHSLSSIREALEQREREMLAPQAAKSADSRGRLRPEPEDDVRPAFQHDRDRIIHSKAFRRLKHKTQVFFAPAGDHYRTRLTHTLEVSQIARTIAKVLRLHEELTEAIALGHDLGHTPFGHAGERVLDALVPGGFRHYEQSLRIVDVLENDGRGLNLTWEVRDGIGRHSKGKKGSPVGLDPVEARGDARRADHARRRPHRLRQPRHRRCGAGRGAERRGPAARAPCAVLGRLLVGAHRAHGQGRRHRDAGRRPDRDPDERGGARGHAGDARVPVRGGLRERRGHRRVQEGDRHPGRPVGEGPRAARTSSSIGASSRPRGWTSRPGTSWPA